MSRSGETCSGFLEAAKNAAGAADQFQQIFAALIGCVWFPHGQQGQRVTDVKFRGLLLRVTGNERRIDLPFAALTYYRN